MGGIFCRGEKTAYLQFLPISGSESTQNHQIARNK